MIETQRLARLYRMTLLCAYPGVRRILPRTARKYVQHSTIR
jgi:hypothetical protein